MALDRKFEELSAPGDARLLHFLQSNFGTGAKGIVGLFGDLLTTKRYPLFSTNFSYPANTDSVVVSLVGTGAVDYDVNMLRLQTGITTGSSAVIRSKRSLRYTAGRDAEGMFTATFSLGVAGVIQRIGLFDDEDGFFIGFNGINFTVNRRKDGEADEVIIQSNFNDDKLDGTGKSGFLLNPTMINIYRITYGYLGTAEIKFQIQTTIDGVTQWVTFHTIDRRNKVAVTSVRIPYLPLCAEVDNGITTENVIITSGSVYAGVFDGIEDDRAARLFSASALAITAAGLDQMVVIFHNKDIFQTIENHIEAQLIYFTAGVESGSNKTITISIYKLPDQDNLVGTWTDVDTENSTFEYSLDEPMILTNKKLMISFALGSSASIREQLKDLFINLLPGEYAGITVTSVGTVDTRTTFRWKELF